MKSWWASLRAKLIASYVGVLVLALATFGAVAVLVIDRDLRASLDTRLTTVARAALNFVDVEGGTARIDERDRAQVFALVSPQIDVAVESARATILSTTPAPPGELLERARNADGLFSLHTAGSGLRAVALPILSNGKPVGSVIAWSSTDWIGDTDRQIAAAFVLAALLLAAVASLAGSSLAQRALDDTLERQRRFTTDAAHELRAPLSVIRAEADLALRKPRDAQAYQAALATIASEAQQMETMVSTLLVAARAQAERSAHVVVDVLAVARGVCLRLQPAAGAKHISVDVATGEAKSTGDPRALERAITAIVHNAIKHTHDGGTIRIWAERRGATWELRVRDGGGGFTSDALQHGLEWFWRGETARTDDHATGLGLAIASSIARASGGGVTLANADEGGALVTISLPAS
ncbi:MAG: HAMP domain-containing histidine kinase [Candidatus Eremiobacteraeota bacterium]|nr:HAMP domain-containing histidine kinase [Candidatus Eremiobacteraeota bacterium]MBV8668136.1 HAMP domain-containing histidine kinase [Candidatus Eremiobacteraeota bacterium]